MTTSTATHQIRLALSADILQRNHLVRPDSLPQPVESFPGMRIGSLGVNDRPRGMMLPDLGFDARDRLLERRLVLVVIRHNAEASALAWLSAQELGTYMS